MGKNSESAADRRMQNRAAHEAAYQRRMAVKKEKEAKQAAATREAAKVQLEKDQRFMKAALDQAKKAYKLGEVPIGCVIVREDQIIARGYNRRNTDHSVLSHAEISALKKASRFLSDWRLDDCTLYVTLEPCQMCAGAIIQARIPSVIIGASSPKSGSGGSIINILQNPNFMHQASVRRGVLKQECSDLLKHFFKELREKSGT